MNTRLARITALAAAWAWAIAAGAAAPAPAPDAPVSAIKPPAATKAEKAEKKKKAANADTPEAKDASVKNCADVAARRLAGSGYDGARAGGVSARRADACILRWERGFSASNPAKVATLIVVPVDMELQTGGVRRNTTLSARCGFNDGKMRAFELVEKDASC